MTREEIANLLNTSKNYYNVLELGTGVGKSKIALDYIINNNISNILIVIPRLVLIENWKNEIIKWGYNDLLNKITFTTYASLHKYCNTNYEIVCFDEAHHLSERCRDILLTIKVKRCLFLSATLKKELKGWLKYHFKGINFITVSLKQAIESDILPDPKVILIPLKLDNRVYNQVLIKQTKSKSNWIDCLYNQRWNYMKHYNCRIKCTEQQYYDEISKTIDYWKEQSMFKPYFTTKWLRTCGERLKWLSDIKTNTVKEILKVLKNYRTLTFCNSIAQTEELGKYCINSKNKESMTYLNMFNEGKIKHITVCDIVNEGVNLADCKIGIFAVINSSEILVKQKNGRILRHKEPIIIIPFYKNTREEELVLKMLDNYNTSLVTTITNINDLKI